MIDKEGSEGDVMCLNELPDRNVILHTQPLRHLVSTDTSLTPVTIS